MERFELSTSSSRTTRANLAALHPDEGTGVGVGVHTAIAMGCKNNKLIRIDVGYDEQFAIPPVRPGFFDCLPDNFLAFRDLRGTRKFDQDGH
jgi:hypothetical protein